jgi:uncharacterized membrane protein (TIGR02234 family)
VAPWATVGADDGLVGVQVTVTGSALAPLAVAAGVVAMASVAALLAVRRWLRLVVAAVVGLLALGAMAQAVAVVVATDERARDWWRIEVGALADEAEVTTTAWPVVTVLGLALVVAGSVLVLARGSGWSGLSSRYDAPGSVRTAPPTGSDDAPDPDLWQALDRGEDPTRDDPPPETTLRDGAGDPPA